MHQACGHTQRMASLARCCQVAHYCFASWVQLQTLLLLHLLLLLLPPC
jgi:hypothetical protein